MANVSILSPFILSFEGGYVNNPYDRGGATKYGITLNTWKLCGYDKNNDHKIDTTDIKLLNGNDFQYILKNKFWDKCKASYINDQSVANILVDWYWASGKYAITNIQRILKIAQDGIIGQNTIRAINNTQPQQLFNLIKQARINFIGRIIENKPSQKIFYNGWLRRINSIGYDWLKCNGQPGKIIKF